MFIEWVGNAWRWPAQQALLPEWVFTTSSPWETVETGWRSLMPWQFAYFALSRPLSLPLSLFLHAGLIAGPSGMQTLNSLLQLNNKKINLALNPRPLVLLILVTKQSNYCTQKPWFIYEMWRTSSRRERKSSLKIKPYCHRVNGCFQTQAPQMPSLLC